MKFIAPQIISTENPTASPTMLLKQQNHTTNLQNKTEVPHQKKNIQKSSNT
ncbi:MAG: hypothetical protein AAGJ35_09035 [Myxococcota bacterium]